MQGASRSAMSAPVLDAADSLSRFIPSRGNALVYDHQIVVRGRVGTPSLP